MGHNIVLAGPTLDHALALVRLGLLDATPLDSFTLARENCTGSSRHLALITKDAPVELAPILTPSNEQPVHLLVADKRDMHRGSIIHHLFQIAHPHNSFMQLCPGVLAPSWPLYYALRCRNMPRLSDRLILCMELCGTYSHLIVGNQTTCTFYRQPVRLNDGSLSTRYDSPRVAAATTKQELMMFLSEARGLRGAHLASEALRYALDNSSSPGESILALMTSLPCEKGGYGFSDLVLNPRIEVNSRERHLTRADSYHPDGYLRHLNTDLEYESNEFHVGSAAVARDKARRNDIQALGIEVKDVTWEMLSHIESLDLLFEQLLDKEYRMGFDKARRHSRKIHHPDSLSLRKTRLQELLPPWPYEG